MGLVSNQNAPANNGNGSRTAAATPGPPYHCSVLPCCSLPSPLLPSLRWCCCCTQPQSIRGAGASAGIVMKKAQGWACVRGMERGGNRGSCFAGLLLLALCCRCAAAAAAVAHAMLYIFAIYFTQHKFICGCNFNSRATVASALPPLPPRSVHTACCICYCCGCKFG